MTESAASVAITGAGAVSSVGVGMAALARALDGASGIRPLERFSTAGFSTRLGACVPGYERRGERGVCVEYAVTAAREALDQARIDAPPRRVALVLGSSLAFLQPRLHDVSERVAALLGVRGPRITVSTACTSSANAVGFARDLLVAGAADVALAGGADELSPELFAGFHALGVLGAEPCSPFGLPAGTTLGEGAGFVVLERGRDARARGAAILGWVLGYGLSCDAYHATSPDPTGSGIARAIAFALADADVAPGAVGYVNAHGTGTVANDPAEARAIAATLRPDVPTSSSKGCLGHAQGAAGILEILVTLSGMRARRLPPTANLRAPRRGAPVDPVPEPRAGDAAICLSTNAAFAGANSAVFVGRDEPAPRPRRREPLVVLGAAAVAGDVDDAADAILDGRRVERRGGPCPIERLLPMADPRGLDPSTRFLTVACARALADAAVAAKGDARDRIGVLAAASSFSPESAHEFDRSVAERGLRRLNATAFAKLVLSAPTGAAARMLGLRGPTSTLATGRGGGVVAVAHAADLLARSGGLDQMVGAGFDEIGHEGEPDDEAEGAAAVVLGRGAPSSHRPRLAAWAIGAPGAARSVIDEALGPRSARDVDLVICDGADAAVDGFARTIDVRGAWGSSRSAAGALACVVAVRALRRGDARRVLVVTNGGGVSAALSFEGGGSDGP